MKRYEKGLLIISGALVAVVLGVMHVFLLPEIQAQAGGIACFDMHSFGYTHETATQFLTQLTDRGHDLFLHAQLPLDFAFLVIYCVFFATALHVLTRSNALIWLPISLAAADIVENTCSVMMLTQGEVSPSLTGFASTATVVKTILMYMTIAAVLVGLFHRILVLRKAKKNSRKDAA